MNTATILANLPANANTRWTPKRKAAVVFAIRAEIMEEVEALAKYGITALELTTWRADVDASGIAGLRATRLQQYRALAA